MVDDQALNWALLVAGGAFLGYLYHCRAKVTTDIYNVFPTWQPQLPNKVQSNPKQYDDTLRGSNVKMW
jgi:hypothetical protein